MAGRQHLAVSDRDHLPRAGLPDDHRRARLGLLRRSGEAAVRLRAHLRHQRREEPDPGLEDQDRGGRPVHAARRSATGSSASAPTTATSTGSTIRGCSRAASGRAACACSTSAIRGGRRSSRTSTPPRRACPGWRGSWSSKRSSGSPPCPGTFYVLKFADGVLDRDRARMSALAMTAGDSACCSAGCAGRCGRGLAGRCSRRAPTAACPARPSSTSARAIPRICWRAPPIGLVQSFDGGASWQWICEQAINVSGECRSADRADRRRQLGAAADGRRQLDQPRPGLHAGPQAPAPLAGSRRSI